MKKLLSIVMIMGLFLILAACGDDDEKTNEEEKAAKEITLEEDEKVDDDKVVIRINDTEVKGAQYNTVYLQTKMRVYQFGQDIEDKENIKEITLNEITAQELIKQEAARQGIDVTEEEVQNEFDTLKSENEDSFTAYLEQYKLTEESLKEQIRFTFTLDKYMQEKVQVDEVTEDDIKEAYDQLKKENEEMMEYEEAKSIIKEQLVQQREAEALQVKVEELMEAAEIEKLI
ncbi:SurA N-terminal domain-containing protein [Ornithinibacillus xuwenensis]|uniref:SurA N-terminal domain-containing protein n=1 Tax=Ornithinibacillus xuwenensis TaxID=3144668 RepID=A0ABU9XKG5_9BACI